MAEYAADLQRQGVTLGLVPTMGYLHEGHLSLVRLLEGRCDLKAASIFVNPIQFGQDEDLGRYPRDEERDLELLAEAGCGLVFCPDAADMYPSGFRTSVEVDTLSQPMCGRFRPGHFSGVATVVLKLFNLTRCSVAAFGLKDYQQAQILRRMVEDLNLPVELLFGETIREQDGLALSTRNAYLSPRERETAQAVPKALEWARRRASEDIRDCTELSRGISSILTSRPEVRVQYVELVDPESLEPRNQVGERVLVAVAAFVGTTRLIDNLIVGPGSTMKPIHGVNV